MRLFCLHVSLEVDADAELRPEADADADAAEEDTVGGWLFMTALVLPVLFGSKDCEE